MTDSHNNNASCGLLGLLVFLLALVTGTACSICSKVMMDLHAIGMTGQVEQFSKPLFQTMGMFVGMMFGLVMHYSVLYWKIPFPGYPHTSVATTSTQTKLTFFHVSVGGILHTEKARLLCVIFETFSSQKLRRKMCF